MKLTLDWRLIRPAIGILILFGLLLVFGERTYPDDWMDFYLPASKDWHNRTVYEVYNPPWLILILTPLFAIGWQVGFALLATVSVIGIGWGAFVLSPDHHWVRVMLAVVNLPVLSILFLGQVDGLALIGVVIAAVWVDWRWVSGGMILALIKPQLAFAAICISFWKNPHKKHIVAVALGFGLLTLLAWGLWFADTVEISPTVNWNRAFPYWPYGAVLGLPLFAYGLYRGEEKYGMLAMPFLVPYLGPQTFIGMIVFWVARLPLRWCWVAWLLPNSWLFIKFFY